MEIALNYFREMEKSGYSPFFLAIPDKNFDLIKVLIQMGFNFTANMENGKTPIGFSRQMRCEKTVDFFRQKLVAKVIERNTKLIHEEPLKNTDFEKLPPDLFLHILSFFSLQELAALSLVKPFWLLAYDQSTSLGKQFNALRKEYEIVSPRIFKLNNSHQIEIQENEGDQIKEMNFKK